MNHDTVSRVLACDDHVAHICAAYVGEQTHELAELLRWHLGVGGVGAGTAAIAAGTDATSRHARGDEALKFTNRVNTHRFFHGQALAVAQGLRRPCFFQGLFSHDVRLPRHNLQSTHTQKKEREEL